MPHVYMVHGTATGGRSPLTQYNPTILDHTNFESDAEGRAVRSSPDKGFTIKLHTYYSQSKSLSAWSRLSTKYESHMSNNQIQHGRAPRQRTSALLDFPCLASAFTSLWEGVSKLRPGPDCHLQIWLSWPLSCLADVQRRTGICMPDAWRICEST